MCALQACAVRRSRLETAKRASLPPFIVVVHSRDVRFIQCCEPHLHTWILYRPDSIEMNLSRQDLYQCSPNIFVCRHRKPVDQISQHTSHCIIWRSPRPPGNDLRKSCDIARNGADLQKRSLSPSPYPVMPPATYSNCRPLPLGYLQIISN